MEKKLKNMIRASGRNTQAYFAGGNEGDRHDGPPAQGTDDHFLLGYGDINQLQRTRDGSRQGDESTGGGNVFAYDREPSLAEGVLTKYKGTTNVPTKRDPATGVEYPFDAEYNFVSRFAVGFNGCCICGATDHFSRTDCPRGIRNKDERRLFLTRRGPINPTQSDNLGMV